MNPETYNYFQNSEGISEKNEKTLEPLTMEEIQNLAKDNENIAQAKEKYDVQKSKIIETSLQNQEVLKIEVTQTIIAKNADNTILDTKIVHSETVQNNEIAQDSPNISVNSDNFENNFSDISNKNTADNTDLESSETPIENPSDNTITNLDASVWESNNLKELTSEIMQSMIATNEFTQKHLTPERIQKAKMGVDYLLKNSDLTPTQAIGIMANAVAESGVDESLNAKHGLGLFQWIGNRKSLFHKMEKNLPGSNSFEKQLSYALFELNGSEKSAYSKVKAAKTPEQAAAAFMIHFERPASKNTTPRTSIAAGLKKMNA